MVVQSQAKIGVVIGKVYAPRIQCLSFSYFQSFHIFHCAKWISSSTMRKRGMNQKELAGQLDIPTQQISKILKGGENLTLEIDLH